ncbi:MAG: CotH kinase family protein [Planctomycetes bacterium]|nr:CotH kinase family protein [Planctomycetota bacterium]
MRFLPSQIPEVRRRSRKPEATDAFFADNEIPTLHLALPPSTIDALRAEPREYAHAALTCNGGEPLADVAIKLKGAAGSFRPIDEERPGFTIKLDKFAPDTQLFGLRKFHLNNAVQDGTFLHEWLASEICRAAGVPATRVAWARVLLNGKNLGLYVLKEPFDKQFLARWFGDVTGNLYDGGFLSDLDADLEKDSGSGPDDRADLRQIVEACAEPTPARRWAAIERLVDIDAFTTFLVVERALGHWDGYCNNQNNYRVYFEPKTGKAFFFAHGMDQVFGDLEMSMYARPAGLLAKAICTNPAWRAEQRKRLGDLLPALRNDKLQQRLAAVAKRVHQALAAIDEGRAKEHDDAFRDLSARLAGRIDNLADQWKTGAPKPMAVAGSKGHVLHGWHEHSECDDAELRQIEVDDKRTLTITAGKSGRCVASWRTSVLLARGKYRLAAQVRVGDLTAVDDLGSCGAALRVSGREASKAVLAGRGWQPLTFDFEVKEDQEEVEAVAELRCGGGRAEFRVESLKISRR